MAGKMRPQLVLEPWVNAQVVAEHIGCCAKTVLKMAADGKLPARAISQGKRTYWRFRLSEVDASDWRPRTQVAA